MAPLGALGFTADIKSLRQTFYPDLENKSVDDRR